MNVRTRLILPLVFVSFFFFLNNDIFSAWRFLHFWPSVCPNHSSFRSIATILILSGNTICKVDQWQNHILSAQRFCDGSPHHVKRCIAFSLYKWTESKTLRQWPLKRFSFGIPLRTWRWSNSRTYGSRLEAEINWRDLFIFLFFNTV